MGNIHCTKCGETASTKCFSQRNVFPTDQTACAYGHLITVEKTEEEYPEESIGRQQGLKKLNTVVTITLPDHKSDDELVELFESFAKTNIKKALCYHNWVMNPGEVCDFECHKGVKRAKKAKTQEEVTNG